MHCRYCHGERWCCSSSAPSKHAALPPTCVASLPLVCLQCQTLARASSQCYNVRQHHVVLCMLNRHPATCLERPHQAAGVIGIQQHSQRAAAGGLVRDGRTGNPGSEQDCPDRCVPGPCCALHAAAAPLRTSMAIGLPRVVSSSCIRGTTPVACDRRLLHHM